MRTNPKLTLSAVMLALVSLATGLSSAPAGASRDVHAYNRTDAAFAAGMLPHHQDGVELGQLAAEKAVDRRIRRLGRDIAVAQRREAATLRRMVRRFRREPSMPKPIEDRDMRDMRALRAASGAEFDRLWLDVISGHHSAAIQMARLEARGGRDRAARRLARRIIATQERELRVFNTLVEQMG